MLTIAKLWESAREPMKNMFSQEPSAQLRAETLHSAPSLNFGIGYLKKGVFTLVLSLKSNSGTVPEHQV